VSINPPRDLSLVNVQRAFEDANREIHKLEKKLDEARGGGGAAAELSDLRGQVQALWRYQRALNPNDVFRASGAAHALGLVPDPGATAGTGKFLREDGAWAQATRGANFSANSVSSGVYVWDAQEFNRASSIIARQNSNKEIVVAEAGDYALDVNVAILWDANSNGYAALKHYNSAAVLQRQIIKGCTNNTAAVAVTPLSWPWLRPCAAGDYFTLLVTISVGTISSYYTNYDYTHFGIAKVN
jgi:hypothetical protein